MNEPSAVLPVFDAIDVAAFLGGAKEFAVLHFPEDHNQTSQRQKANPLQKSSIAVSASVAVLQGDLNWYNADSKKAEFNLRKATFKIHQGVADINEALLNFSADLQVSTLTTIDTPEIARKISALQNKFNAIIKTANTVVAQWPAEQFDDKPTSGAVARIRTPSAAKHRRG